MGWYLPLYIVPWYIYNVFFSGENLQWRQPYHKLDNQRHEVGCRNGKRAGPCFMVPACHDVLVNP